MWTVCWPCRGVDMSLLKNALCSVARSVIIDELDGLQDLYIIAFNSIQFSFIYIAPNYNNCHLKAL